MTGALSEFSSVSPSNIGSGTPQQRQYRLHSHGIFEHLASSHVYHTGGPTVSSSASEAVCRCGGDVDAAARCARQGTEPEERRNEGGLKKECQELSCSCV